MRTILLVSPSPVCVTNPEGKVLIWNPACERLFGWSESEVLGKLIRKMLVPADRKEEAEWSIAAITSGEIVHGIETVRQKKDGSLVDLRVTYAPVIDEKGGAHIARVAIMEDISERKSKEREIQRVQERERLAHLETAQSRKSLEFLAGVANSLSDSLDLQTVVTRVASLAIPMLADYCIVDIMGESGALVMGYAHRDPEREPHILELRKKYPPDNNPKYPFALVIETARSAIYPVVTDAMLTYASANEECLSLMRRLAPTSNIVVPLRARGKTIGVISFVYVGSERAYGKDDLELCETFAQRAALAIENASLFKQATDAAKIREDFLSIASHELKNPLTAIRSQTQLLRRMLTEGRIGQLGKLLDSADRDVARLANLVNSLFDNTCIAAGQLLLKKEQIDLAALSRNVLSRLKLEIDSSGSKVDLKSDPAVVGFWDRLRLEQVLINLLSNALKYGCAKPITVNLHNQNGIAALSVEDKGIGIPKGNLERIFDRFERATAEKRVGSLGLGLFIARQIVQAHRGTISVISGPGEGSKFTVEIPLQEQ